MTVIVWDGETLAADKRVISGSLTRKTTKIFRVGETLAGYFGEADAGEEVLAWFAAGHAPDKFPQSQRSKDDWAGLLIVWPDKTLWIYERTPHPIVLSPQQIAVGSGRDFAMAAMHCGRTAAAAVAVACEFDCSCGDGVDQLQHVISSKVEVGEVPKRGLSGRMTCTGIPAPVIRRIIR